MWFRDWACDGLVGSRFLPVNMVLENGWVPYGMVGLIEVVLTFMVLADYAW